MRSIGYGIGYVAGNIMYNKFIHGLTIGYVFGVTIVTIVKSFGM